MSTITDPDTVGGAGADAGHDIVLITGANKGLGFETARRLAVRGATVLLGSRDPVRGAEAVAKLAADAEGGIDVRPLSVDVTSDVSVAAAAAEVETLFGRLDVLVNNAGIVGNRVAPADAGPDDLLLVYETNVFGPVRMVRAFLPLLRRAALPRIVMVSSGMGSMTVTSDPARLESSIVSLPYPSSKAALNMITNQYARALPDVKVNAVDPGYTATDFNNHGGVKSVEQGAEIIVRMATIDADGPTGSYQDDAGTVPW